VGEPLDWPARVNGLGGINADEADLDRLAIEVDHDGVAVDDPENPRGERLRDRGESVWILGRAVCHQDEERDHRRR
jgi:hypothetical protein